MNPRSLFYVEKWPGVDFRWGSLFVVTPARIQEFSSGGVQLFENKKKEEDRKREVVVHGSFPSAEVYM